MISLKSCSMSLAAISLLVAVGAKADPKVGDQAQYALTLSGNGQTITGTALIQLTQLNATNGQFLQHADVEIPGVVGNDQDTWNTEATDAQITDVLTNCASSGGTSETLQTPAGTFPTCAVTTSTLCAGATSCTAWIAHVPIGVAKVQFDVGGATITMVLSSFQAGK